MSIPKILHFTWKTKDVPGVMGDYLARWRALHPDWDVRLWTDATMQEFVETTYPDFAAAYAGYPRPIQRADSFRYLVLNAMGGVYADLDVEPFRAIDELVEGQECFAGIEPDENMGSDRWHSGAPFLVSNAFMGGVAGHPWFAKLVELLPRTAGIADIFQSTGPSVTTAAALRLPRAERPVLVLPEQWFPEDEYKRAIVSDAKLRQMLSGAFDFVDAQGRNVAHRCMTTWVPWYKRRGWMAVPFHLMNRGKWALRRLLHPDLARVSVPDALFPYFDQYPKPPKTWPKVAAASIGSGAAAALNSITYPKGKFVSIGSFDTATAPLTEMHRSLIAWAQAANQAIETALAGDAAWLLLADESVADVPSEALKAMLSADKPVVALAARTVDGREIDRSVFRYHWGGLFKVMYKVRGADGVADPDKGQRDFLTDTLAFAQVPLDGVGQSFVLIRRDVLEAGVRFAETPYHMHLGGEGFALMARHKGFEAAGLTDLVVRK